MKLPHMSSQTPTIDRHRSNQRGIEEWCLSQPESRTNYTVLDSQLWTTMTFFGIFNSIFLWGHMTSLFLSLSLRSFPLSLSFSSSLFFSHPLMLYDISLHRLSFLNIYYFSPLTDEWLLCTFKLACLLLIVASLLSFTYQAARPQALCSSLKFRKQAIYYQ